MDYNYKASEKVMNKIYFELADRYGWENVPYEYSETGYGKRTTKIEIPCWRYDIWFLKDLMIKYDLTLFDFKGNDTIFISCLEKYKAF